MTSGKLPVKTTESDSVLTQSDWLGIGPTRVGVGLTIIVNISGVPSHPLIDGITVIVAVCSTAVVFSTTKEPILPKPFSGNPMDIFVFVQVYVAADPKSPSKTTGIVAKSAHKT